MKIYIDNFKNLVIIIIIIIISPKIICSDLPIKVNEILKHDIKFIISHNESFAEYTIRKKLRKLLFKCWDTHKKELSCLLKSLI